MGGRLARTVCSKSCAKLLILLQNSRHLAQGFCPCRPFNEQPRNHAAGTRTCRTPLTPASTRVTPRCDSRNEARAPRHTCQRMPPHLPTRRTASANAAHCIRQRSALHPPSRRTASAIAAHCVFSCAQVSHGAFRAAPPPLARKKEVPHGTLAGTCSCQSAMGDALPDGAGAWLRPAPVLPRMCSPAPRRSHPPRSQPTCHTTG